MSDIETVELWLSESCSVAFLRMGDAVRGIENVYFMHLLQHQIERLQCVHARHRAGGESSPLVRSERYRLGARTIVLEQQGPCMRLMISGADEHRYLRFHPVDPRRSHAGQMLIRLLDLPALRSDEGSASTSGSQQPRGE